MLPEIEREKIKKELRKQTRKFDKAPAIGKKRIEKKINSLMRRWDAV